MSESVQWLLRLIVEAVSHERRPSGRHFDSAFQITSRFQAVGDPLAAGHEMGSLLIRTKTCQPLPRNLPDTPRIFQNEVLSRWRPWWAGY